MTKKRFHYDRALDKFKDRNTGDDYYDCDIAELVNYLYEENKELKELDSEVDNELEIRDIVCSAGKFRLEEMGKT